MDKNNTKRNLISVIGDEDSVTGLLLSGIGNIGKDQNSNFLVVKEDTKQKQLEEKLQEFIEREDIAIILITQNVASRLQSILENYNSPLPAILEIPSKDMAYDSSKDTIIKRVQKLFSDENR